MLLRYLKSYIYNSVAELREKENPGLPMRIDHGRMMLGDEDKGYNPGYSFYGRMLALAQVEGMMTVVDDEIKRQMKL